MRRIIVFIGIALLSINALFAQEIKKEEDAIKKVIQTAYVDGLQNKGNVEDIENAHC